MDAGRYAATEILRDGRTLLIRALRPEDRAELEAAAGRLSDESIYRRFFTLKRRFSEREAEYYTHVDFVQHVALAAVLREQGRERIVGTARYVVSEPGAAEVAFVVDDAHQGQGIGSRLMRHLAGIAREAGLQRLVAEVLAANAPMLRMFEKSGLRARTKRERDVLLLTLDLS